MQVKKQQLELDVEQQTGSKSGKEYIKAVYCHPAYLTYKQSTSWEMLGWIKHKLESRLPGEISITSDMQMTPPWLHKAKKNSDAGKDWGQEKGTIEDEMVVWHHWRNRHEVEHTLGVGDGQESLACCSPWARK